MAKGKNPGISLLVLLGSLAFLWVVFGAWNGWAGNLRDLTAFGNVLWALIFGAATISSVGLLFMALAGFMTGWDKDMQESGRRSMKWAAIGLAAISIATGGTVWFYATIVGFILVWFGLDWATM